LRYSRASKMTGIGKGKYAQAKSAALRPRGSINTGALEVPMGTFDDKVLCNHELFGVPKGETHQANDLHSQGGAFEQYEITASGHLEGLEHRIEDRSDPGAEGWRRLFGAMTPVFTGGLRDLNYHGWLNLSGFGRAKFTDGMLVAFEPVKSQTSESVCEESKAAQSGEESGVRKCNPVPESTARAKPRQS